MTMYGHKRHKVLSFWLGAPSAELEVIEVYTWWETGFPDDIQMFACPCGYECDGCDRLFIPGRRKKLMELSKQFPKIKRTKVFVSERRITFDDDE